MTYLEKIAKRLKPPQPQIGVTVGTIISVKPLKVRISDEITAKSPNLAYISDLVITDEDIGARVIVVASRDNQRFYILGKAAFA